MEKKDRFAMVIKESGLKKGEFANKLKINRDYLSQILSGKGNPSDRLLEDIANTFDINFEWLKNGTGEMKKDRSREEEILSFIHRILNDEDSVINDFIYALSKLNTKDLKDIERISRKLLEKK